MLKFDREGLIPVVIQEDSTNDVLMVAFMNQEALYLTRKTGFTHFFSRSRNTIWHKGEQSGNTQEVRGIYVNCEENSLLIKVTQHGDAACHMGYHSCYYRRLQPDDSYEEVAKRVFDPEIVYGAKHEFPIAIEYNDTATSQKLEEDLRLLYGAYIYLRDNDMSEESNTSRLLQERSHSYLVARLADELQELAGVQSGEHAHTNREDDTILEGSQVSYWLLLLASTHNLRYDDFLPHASLLSGYHEQYTESKAIEQQQDCLSLLTANEPNTIIQGLHLGFALVGWACAEAKISPLAPAEFDLEQMRRKGLVR
ncbi:MAG TPA: phosphoribosyl-AMP cyclohydrolase [Ktedonobacteraceae bacterium]|nr:phosphoribosyl-AMP cyclohydrolase [Ktedonobacteraceae bacterium]